MLDKFHENLFTLASVLVTKTDIECISYRRGMTGSNVQRVQDKKGKKLKNREKKAKKKIKKKQANKMKNREKWAKINEEQRQMVKKNKE